MNNYNHCDIKLYLTIKLANNTTQFLLNITYINKFI